MVKEESFKHSHRNIWLEIDRKSLPPQLDKIIQDGNFFPANDYFRVSMPLEKNKDSYFFRIEFNGKYNGVLRFSFNSHGWNNIVFRLLVDETDFQKHGAKVPENVVPVILGSSRHCICNHPKNCRYCHVKKADRPIYTVNCLPNYSFTVIRQ